MGLDDDDDDGMQLERKGLELQARTMSAQQLFKVALMTVCAHILLSHGL